MIPNKNQEKEKCDTNSKFAGSQEVPKKKKTDAARQWNGRN